MIEKTEDGRYQDRDLKIPVRSYLDLCSAHLPPSDYALFDKIIASDKKASNKGTIPCSVVVYCNESGYSVNSSCAHDFDGRYSLALFGFSLALIDILTYSEKNGYWGAWFDGDANLANAWPRFDANGKLE